jgi:hypothetical protein
MEALKASIAKREPAAAAASKAEGPKPVAVLERKPAKRAPRAAEAETASAPAKARKKG